MKKIRKNVIILVFLVLISFLSMQINNHYMPIQNQNNLNNDNIDPKTGFELNPAILTMTENNSQFYQNNDISINITLYFAKNLYYIARDNYQIILFGEINSFNMELSLKINSQKTGLHIIEIEIYNQNISLQKEDFITSHNITIEIIPKNDSIPEEQKNIFQKIFENIMNFFNIRSSEQIIGIFTSIGGIGLFLFIYKKLKNPKKWFIGIKLSEIPKISITTSLIGSDENWISNSLKRKLEKRMNKDRYFSQINIDKLDDMIFLKNI